MNDEIDLVELIRVLWKRKWLILIPSMLVVISVFLYFQIIPAKISAKTTVYTKDLLLLIQNDNETDKNFTILEYNKYIAPVIDEVKRAEKESGKKYYDIKIGEMENLRSGALKDKNIYNFFILRKFKESKEDNAKELFSKDIDDFFNRLGKRIFTEYKTSLFMEKYELGKNITSTKLNLSVINKKIDLLKKYLKGNKFNFVNISETQLTFLPPWQQYTGLSIQKDQTNLRLNILKEQLFELNTIIKEIKKNNIGDFSKLSDNEDVKHWKYYYPDIRDKTERLKILRADAKNNIIIKGDKIGIGKIVLISFILSLLFFMFLSLILEWWKENKPLDI